jgi:anti-anti-sigma factor
MSNGRILYATHEGVVVLRFIGEIRYTTGPALENFVESAFTESGPKGFVIDLTDTRSIDSTNLGILARIAKRMQLRDGPRVSIVSSREEINEVLASMSFDEVFDIVASSMTEAGRMEELESKEPDAVTLAHTLLGAHRTLMSLSEYNADLFHDVVAALEQDTGGKR